MSIFIIEKSWFCEMFNHFIDVIIKHWNNMFHSIYGAFFPLLKYCLKIKERNVFKKMNNLEIILVKAQDFCLHKFNVRLTKTKYWYYTIATIIKSLSPLSSPKNLINLFRSFWMLKEIWDLNKLFFCLFIFRIKTKISF